ncbi:MAG TPA: hypothetical protein VK896_13470, partial [Gaiellaceae bacterium]|nr:hypothetical protein [Gaiellaceae bacterium]
MPRNPLDEAGRALRQLGERLRETGGPEGEWIAEQLDRLQPDARRRAPAEPEKTLEELQAELDALVGLDTVK